MPFPNESACRVRPPGQFQPGSFRRISEGRLDIIIGRPRGQTTTATQAFRYPIDDWDIAEARSHCRRNGGELFEPPTGRGEAERITRD